MRSMFPILLMLAGLAYADDDPPMSEPESPVAVVKGPSQGLPGDIIILSSEDSVNAEHVKWDVKLLTPLKSTKEPNVSTKISDLEKLGYEVKGPFTTFPLSHFISHDGRTLQVASRPGAKYDIVLAVGNSVGLDIKRWHVEIEKCDDKPDTPDNPGDDGDTPDPPDDPDPPDPDVPDLDLSDEVREWKSLVTFQTDRLPNFGRTIIQIGERVQELGNKDSVDQMITFAITSDYENQMHDWKPLFLKIDEALANLKDKVTLKEYGQVLISLGEGLQ